MTIRSVLATAIAGVTTCLLGIPLLAQSAPATPTLAVKPAEPKLTGAQQFELERQLAVHVLNRCAFGPRPQDINRVIETGWKKWVEQQLEPDKINDDKLEARIKEKYPSMRMSLGEAMAKYWPTAEMMGGDSEEAQRKRNQLRYQIRAEMKESVLTRAVESERMFNEVIVEFWRNHFNVDQNKDDLVYLCPDYEETVIRRHAFGKFRDMLAASAHHPAMLIYLDNVVSQRPLTPEEMKRINRANEMADRRANYKKPRSVVALERHRGLNENYARELFELHTLGADNFYKQWDVTEAARVLTGWSVNRSRNNEYGFYFRKDYHDTLPKTILGISISGRGGYDDGMGLINFLATHRGTSQFISWKLVKYLVNDEPPITLVNKAAQTFRTTGGDLRKVYRTILTSDEFIAAANRKAKFKTPFEYVVSSVRATGATVEDWGPTIGLLARMGQPIYECEDPTGYYDQAEAWCDPGVLVHRWSFAMKLANDKLEGIKLPDKFIQRYAELDPAEAKNKLTYSVVPGGVDPHTAEAMDRAAEGMRGGERSCRKLLGLLLGSPAFMQQ